LRIALDGCCSALNDEDGVESTDETDEGPFHDDEAGLAAGSYELPSV